MGGTKMDQANDTLGNPGSPPRILALETSGRIGSVAVAQGPNLLAARTFSHTMRHAADLMPTVAELTAAAGWQPRDIEQIYLSIGPGSFTGLRVAVAAARAMHQAIGCRLLAVSTLEVIAQNAPPAARQVVVVLDAKRGQVFGARYRRAADNPVEPGPMRCVAQPTLIDPAALVNQALTDAGTRESVYIMGEGVDYHRPALLSAGTVIEVDHEAWRGRAEIVHALGWQRLTAIGPAAFSDPQTLLPVYIRLPEAEEVWQKKQAQGSKT